jgi:2'-hydroxyisoflavone reductase
MTYSRALGTLRESSALLDIPDHARLNQTLQPANWDDYGSWKVACEKAAAVHFSSRCLIVRPGVISGPGDPADHLAFWFYRFEVGGEILVPGEASRPIQFIDARDLAIWMANVIQDRVTGIFNATGPREPMNMGELIEAIADLIPSRSEIFWAPAEWLSAKGVRGDDGPFFWCRLLQDALPSELWLSYEVSSAQALGRGLHLRSAAETIIDNLNWYRTLSDERQMKPRTGWSASSERTMLEAFHLRG